MERKYVKCKRCGEGGLYWRKSAKGNWYLVDGRFITTRRDNNLYIPFAHRCSKRVLDEIEKNKHYEEYGSLGYESRHFDRGDRYADVGDGWHGYEW